MIRRILRAGAVFVSSMPTAVRVELDARRSAAVIYPELGWAQRDAELLRAWGLNAWVEEVAEERAS
jgi:hypothetical protein